MPVFWRDSEQSDRRAWRFLLYDTSTSLPAGDIPVGGPPSPLSGPPVLRPHERLTHSRLQHQSSFHHSSYPPVADGLPDPPPRSPQR